MCVLCRGVGEAAEGDLTGDASMGLIGKPLTELELYSLGASRSIGIGEDGRVYFTAEFDRDMETMSGFYSVKIPVRWR